MTDIDRAAKLYRGGMTLDEVAAKFGVSLSSIWKRLAAAGVEMRARGRSVKIDIDHAAKLYRSGLTLAEVAAKFGVSATTIRRRLADAGIEMRAPSVDLDVSHETVRKRLKSGGTAVRRHGHNSRRSASLRPMTPANQQAS